jgi:hypothetical protein
MKLVFEHKSPSSWQRTVVIIFITAMLIRVGFVLSLQDGFYFPDSLDYVASAVRLIGYGDFGDTYRRAPVYPVFLAGIYLLFGQQILVIRLVEALLGACLAVVIATLARRVGGEDVGALAGLLWSIYPTGVFIVGLVYPTHLATLLLACAVLNNQHRSGLSAPTRYRRRYLPWPRCTDSAGCSGNGCRGQLLDHLLAARSPPGFDNSPSLRRLSGICAMDCA